MTTQDEAIKEKAAIWAELDAAEARGETPQPKRAETQDVRATADPAPQAQTPAADAAVVASDAGEAADPYAGIPQVVRDEIAGLKTMFSQTVTRLRNAEGHIGGLNGKLKELGEAAKTARSEGGDAPSAAALREAQGSAAAMNKLKADYPEFGSALEAAANEQLQEIRAAVDKAKSAGSATPGVTQGDLDALRREFAVERAHPDWQVTVKTPAFAGWLQGQAREVQMLAASDSPQDAVRLLDLHREARSAGSEKNSQRLAAAAAIPTGRAGSSARVKPLDQMTKAEYWAYLDEQDRAAGKAV